ncbi:MAG: MlaD family protein [Muribaculaceae bacterium]|nr:MlaD family protein [Muribaculaceae bacterium]MDE6487470.1 MlaD family protein [Muribaculaceae bacterium]
MNKVLKKELTIGGLVILALAVLFFGIDFLKGVNVFKASNYYYVEYTNVEGLAISAPVTLNGFKVGQVREINYEFDNPGHVMVEVSLEKKLRLPQGTKAVLTTDLLGTASIVLKPGEGDGWQSVGDRLEGVADKGLMANVGGMMPTVEAIFPKIDTLLTNLNAITGDPALTASVKRLDAITGNLEATTTRLSVLMAQLQPVARNVGSVTSNLDSITGDVAVLTAQLRELPVDSLSADLAATIANLQALSEELKNPDGSLGMLMKDPALYNNLNSTVSSLDSLFVDIKKNPKRYINIKLL